MQMSKVQKNARVDSRARGHARDAPAASALARIKPSFQTLPNKLGRIKPAIPFLPLSSCLGTLFYLLPSMKTGICPSSARTNQNGCQHLSCAAETPRPAASRNLGDEANGRSTISLARPPCNMLQCRSSEQQDKRLTTTHFCCHSSSSETVELYIPRVNVVLDCTVSMIRFVLCLVFLDQSQGLSNLAHVREQNASLTVLQADVNALADSSSRLTLAASQQQKPTKTSTMYRSLSDDFNVVLRSFSVVAVAELFDKTWFVALICAPLMAFGGRRHSHDHGLSLRMFLPVCASSDSGQSKRVSVTTGLRARA